MRVKFYDYIELNDSGFPMRVISAFHEKTGLRVDVYREYDDGYNEYRGLQFNYLSGYSLYEGYEDCGVAKCDEDILLQVSPDFKYLVNKVYAQGKHFCGLNSLFEAYKIWLKYPKAELLFAAGFEKLAYNKAFYNYTEKKQRAIISYRKALGNNDADCISICNAINNKIPPEMFAIYSKIRKIIGKTDLKTVNYLQKNNIDPCLYRDYLVMCEQLEHDVTNNYWKYPSDFTQAHAKLVAEECAVEAAKNQEKFKDLYKAIKKISEYNINNDKAAGYSVFCSADYQDWEIQAHVLNQCIIRAKYYDNVIKGQSFIVFIRKNNIPIATAEIFPDGSVGQFYGDEFNYYDCKPSDNVRKALDISKINFKKLRRRRSA